MVKKRKSSDLTKEIYKMIKKNPNISMSSLERKVGTNPYSLKDHCHILEYFGIIKIEKKENTTILKLLRSI